MLPEIGKHKAKLCATPVYIEGKGNEGLQLTLACEVMEGESVGRKITAFQVLFSKAGKEQQRVIDKLQAIFGPANGDLYWLEKADTSAVEFEIDVLDEEYDGKTTRKVKWLNELGGGMFKVEAADRKSVLTKYGAKFRALTGTAKAAPAKPATASAAPKPPASAPKAEAIADSTEAEAWDEFCKDNVGKSDEDIARLWFADLKKLFPGRDKNTFTPQEWGKVKDSIGPGF